MAIRRIGIPAIPAGFKAEQHALFSAMRQELLRLDREIISLRDDLATALLTGPNAIADLGVASGVVTLTPDRGFLQKIINNGAFTLQPPVVNSFIRLAVIEGPADGTITTSGFNTVSGSYAGHGTGSVYFASVVVIDGTSWLQWNRAK